MEEYKNLSLNSPILKYKIGDEYIIIEFDSNNYKFYRYTNMATWKEIIDEMKKLAILGKWLSTYISKNKPKFENKYKLLSEILN